MAPPPHTQEFEDAIAVTPLSSHTYSANLSPQWCIGSVPHGGYTTAILHRLATTHFKHTHPTRHHSDPMPISMQLSFLRRTAAGPALLTVQDAKLGARTSTIHVELSQEEDLPSSTTSPPSEGKKKSVKVVGYITVSDPASEVGVSAPSDWRVYPPPPSSRPPEFVTGDDNRLVPASPWVRISQQYSNFRLATNHTEVFGPADPHAGQRRRGITDQWARFRPLGEKGGQGRWTDEAVAYLIDLYPMALEALETSSSSSPSSKTAGGEVEKEESNPGPFWFPTVTLNIDFKKRLPPTGVEWLYSRVTTKSVRNGRTDFDVVVLDEKGEVVALATQVGLVVSAMRNLSGRALPGKNKKIGGGSGGGRRSGREAKI
ncbi:hypothetical protein VTN77DRAFT_1697 [Rasamsonia byssochlamydoides]|uniref:uncharacterized protein n=1 Tax=Rasamsonia byssochlamydoides TaxID=89139 RepID=UPI00374447D8